MRGLKAAAAAALFVVVGTGAAIAHATMTSSLPKDGATVPPALSEIELNFSKPLRLTLVNVVRASDQQQIPTTSALPTSVEKSVKIGIAPLLAGSYKVSWTAVAEDGHVMKGTFGFSVNEANSPQAK